MENKNHILQELMELSPAVANLSRENTYSVPVGYFDKFPGSVLLRIKGEEMAFGAKSTPFHVPSGYFEGLANNILSKVKQVQPRSVHEELEEIAPLLNTISKQAVYSVPEGYFESLELTIPLKLDKPSARVFSFGKVRKVAQYAVAACTAVVLIVGAYFYTGNNSAEDTVISYDSALNMDVAEELSEVQVDNINTYLNEAPTVGYAVQTNEEVELEQYINTVSDDEIKQYLDETGGSKQAASAGS